MIGNYFVNISTCFNKNITRNIKELSLLYEDRGYLKSVIKELTNNKLTIDNIKSKRVLLKPNWVRHNLKHSDEICLRTHEKFVLAALEVILEKKPLSVTIADAPLQGGVWEKIVTKEFKKEILSLGKKNDINVKLKDLRRVIFDPKTNSLEIERNPLSEYIIFDLAEKSFLEPITNKKSNFRVVDYDPNRLSYSHAPGVHKYCISKELFENDIIISLPKVKTHQKAGITNALKNLVGINGDKDFLPHHRKGSPEEGGDCYPNKNVFRKYSENIIDLANRRRGKWSYKIFRKIGSLFWILSNPSIEDTLSAAWYGNDTTWRMVMDLNLIAKFGKADGMIGNTAQRDMYNLCDGIIGGQGDGPLKPDPLALGIICFSNNAPMTDNIMAELMGFDTSKIPLLISALEYEKSDDVVIKFNGKEILIDDISQFSISTEPPPGWKKQLKK